MRQKLIQTFLRLIARYSASRAIGLVTMLTTSASLAVRLIAGVWMGNNLSSSLLAIAIPMILTPPISYLAYAALAHIVDLQRDLQEEIELRKQVEQKFRRQAITDPLTKTGNRRRFMELSRKELARAQRYGKPLSILALDLDRLKRINDTHGHGAGDQALIRAVQICQENIREQDILARLGGDELAILLPETDIDGAALSAERIRWAFAESPLSIDGISIPLTVSIGLSRLIDGDGAIDPLLARADRALYQAKREGRNRVAIAS